MTSRTAFLSIALFGSTACSVIEVPPPPDAIAINQCETDDDCGKREGVCDDGACVARSGTLTALIVEVVPRAGGPSSGGLPYYLHVDDLTARDLAIDSVVHVTGKVSMPVVSTTGTEPCTFVGSAPDNIVREAADGTVPVDASFTPSERVLGISVTPYSTSVPITGFDAPSPGTASGHRFDAALPPGDYDIYIQPRKQVPGSCELLPVLLRKQHVAGDLDVTLPPPSLLPLVIRVPLDDELAGWTLDMLDSGTGRVLSIPETLQPGTPSAEGQAKEYQVTLRFATALTQDAEGKHVADTSGTEVVRLSPPEGHTAPVLLYERGALGALTKPGEASIIDLTLSDGNAIRSMALPPTVTVYGETARLDDHSPVEATVTMMATSIDGLTPQPASFVATGQVDETGLFQLDVVPGTYRVRAVPKASLDLATAETIWQVARTPQAQHGKTIEFGSATFINGSAQLSPNGWAFGATVRASASPFSIREYVLDEVLGESAAVPLASSDIVRGDGGFHLSAEVGSYDFFVQPEARSRYSWYVRPSTIVGAEGRSLDFRVPLPVIHRGRIVIRGFSVGVPGALLRAYAYVTDVGKYSATPTASVVQVAEARADENGAFELLIPAGLDSGR